MRAYLHFFLLCLSLGRLLTEVFIANYDDPLANERDAPPEALPIQFPKYCPVLKSTPLTTQKHSELKKLLTGIRNPAELTPGLVETFNIKYRSDVAVSDLVPELPDGLLEEAALNTIIKEEFKLDNDPCFRKVCRLPLEKGQTLPRLSQAYLFYKHLEDMSRYWDNSKDNYFTQSPTTSSSRSFRHPLPPFMQKENIRPQSIDSNGDIQMPNSYPEDLPKINSPAPQNLYTGRRNGNAATMPPQMRDGTLEGFLRAATQKFNAVCKPPAQQYARLQVGNCLIPVRQTCVVGRVPNDRAEARKAKTCGPMMVGSARAEVVFRKDGEEAGHGQGEVADFLRELGGLLLLAQQRNREGGTEVRPGVGEHAWWTKKERWGGQAGGKMPHEEPSEAAEDFPKVVVDRDVSLRDTSNGHTRTKRSMDISIAKDTDELMDSSDLPGSSRAKSPASITANVSNGTVSLMESLSRVEPNNPTPGTPGDPHDTSSSPPTLPSTMRKPSAISARPNRPPMSSRRVKMLAESWKILRGPSALWDPNMTYEAIGRAEKDGDWDDLFMFSSVNTHVCLLKMRVSRGYLDWLERGSTMNGERAKERTVGRSGIALPAKEERDWEGEVLRGEVLYVERSAWWDFFVPEERVEALRSLWGCLSWLSREVGSGGGKVFGSVE